MKGFGKLLDYVYGVTDYKEQLEDIFKPTLFEIMDKRKGFKIELPICRRRKNN